MSNILKLKNVVSKVGLSRSTIYNQINSGDFPKQIRLGKRSVGFLESEIDDWIMKRVAESRADEGVSQ